MQNRVNPFKKIFLDKLSNYVVHSTETSLTRPIDEHIKPHLYRLVLKAFQARQKNFLGIIEGVMEDYHALCKAHKITPKISPKESFKEIGELAEKQRSQSN